jgi:probable F420-dependent oxidoreductase
MGAPIATDLGRVGIWSRELRFHADRGAAKEAAVELEELGYGALWIPDVGGDVLEKADELLTATAAVPLATGILNIWMHRPDAVSAGVAALDSRHGRRFVLGLGASHAPVVDADTPGRYGRPYTTMVDYLDALDAQPAPLPHSRRILAALGPRMLELSRDRGAGAHPYLVTAEHTRRARALLGPDRLLAPELSVALEPDPAVALERARRFVADYLALPNYVNNFLRIGFDEADVAAPGSDRLVSALVATGDEAAIAARVAELHEAGADHVAVHVIGAGETLPRATWRALAPALLG